jgi:hypothetical protein
MTYINRRASDQSLATATATATRTSAAPAARHHIIVRLPQPTSISPSTSAMPPPPPRSPAAPAPPPPHTEWPKPTLTLRIDDISHPGSGIFLHSLDPSTALRTATISALTHLYLKPSNAPIHVESVTFIVRPMDGVAYTTGTHAHKQIHISCQHIVNSEARAKEEIEGVLVHEAVHCFQNNAGGTAPGGLIEGIAGALVASFFFLTS